MQSTKLWPPSKGVFWVAVVLIVAIGLAACAGLAVEDSTTEEGDVTSAEAPQEESAATEDTGDSETAEADDAAAPISLEGLETYKDIPVGFTADGLPFRGDPNAPVTLYEFSDLQCPFCNRHFVQTEPVIDESYVRNGDVRVIFRDFPIAQLHPNAPAGHLAALCVAEQGSARAYWEMREQLFRTSPAWASADGSSQHFVDLATEIGVDIPDFEACMADADMAAQIESRVAEAASFGFSGTPSFQFVNEASGDSYQIVGAQPFDQFASMIDALVAGEAPPQAQAESGGDEGGSGEAPYWATSEGLQPDPDRPGYTLAGDQFRGNPDASVVVVEYSDFQCPYCQRHILETQPVLDETFVDTDQVFWVFKHFPLSIHPQAPAAAVAAECAAEQDAFWEMHHALFESMSTWGVSDPTSALTDVASEQGLDVEAFAACLQDESMMARVESDVQEGAQFVRGTPTFVVLYGNEGRILPGALPAEQFVDFIQETLDGLSTE